MIKEENSCNSKDTHFRVSEMIAHWSSELLSKHDYLTSKEQTSVIIIHK